MQVSGEEGVKRFFTVWAVPGSKKMAGDGRVPFFSSSSLSSIEIMVAAALPGGKHER